MACRGWYAVAGDNSGTARKLAEQDRETTVAETSRSWNRCGAAS